MIETAAVTATVTATAAMVNGSPLTFTASATAGTASQIALVSGNNQTGPVLTALAAFVVFYATCFVTTWWTYARLDLESAGVGAELPAGEAG